MAAVGLGFVTPLADTHAAIAFLLNRDNDLLTLLFRRHHALVGVGLGLLLHKRALCRDKILVVFVLVVLGEFNSFFYLAVCESPIKGSMNGLTLTLG